MSSDERPGDEQFPPRTSVSSEVVDALWAKANAHPDEYKSLTPEEQRIVMEWEFDHQH